MSNWFIDLVSRNFDWQIRFDKEEAVFMRPTGEKIFWGLPVAGLTWLYFFWIIPTFIHRIGQPDIRSLMLQTTSVYVGLVITFSMGMGPKDMRFDFRKGCYEYRYGFPIFHFIRRGELSEISHFSAWSTSKFVGLAVEWKDRKRFQTTFVSCSSKRSAQALGERLGASLGVVVKDGVMMGFNR